jgi:hypothetical protein
LIEERCKAHFEIFKAEVNEIVNNKIDEVQVGLRTMETKLKQEDEAIRKEINDLREELDTKFTKVVDEAATTSVQEIQERRNRVNNAMVFKLSESTKAAPEDRKADDIIQINEICKILGVQVDVMQATRIGKKVGDRMRPLKLVLQSRQQVDNLVRSSKKLQECAKKEFERVVIKNDMTPMEREEMKTLLRIRDQKREESRSKGEAVNWVIRGGKVIKGKPPETEEPRG